MPELTPRNEIPILQRLDWSQWTDGQWRTFYQDTDYPGRTARQVYESACKYARRYGFGFCGRIQVDRLLIQMWPKEAPDDGGDATEPAATERADPLG